MWPSELLGRFLHFLALDGAERTFFHLAYLTCNNDNLKQLAREMERPMVMRVAFSNEHQGEPRRVFVIPFYPAKAINIEIHWGDGCVDVVRDGDAKFARHEYAAAGEYTVRVFRASTSVGLNHLGLMDGRRGSAWYTPLVALESLGNLGIRSLNHLFYRALFVNADLSRLNVSDIESMQGMFDGASRFDQRIAGWDVSKVTNMSNMFKGALKFNQPIGAWDVGNVKNFEGMFDDARDFKQPLAWKS
eukprot:TRINITY_DN6136_c0_g1_i1.p1 TRINITY_DN6136_c0_g1~~TRINITY_DN6136_c0_g1_i1.p1  ORF type:complete len:246 (-),score=27.67 TRINITY_DN6136_c0_g1_i1:946-1683(-)